MAMRPLTKPDAIPLQFEAAIAGARDHLFLACSNKDERFEGFARLCQYRADSNPTWRYSDLPTTVACGTFFQPSLEAGSASGSNAFGATAAPAFVFLSEEGDVMYLPPGRDAITERIAGSGLWSDDSEGWGYMIAIAQIGSRLHACGSGGQVYRSTESGTWEHMDAGLLRKKGDRHGIMLKAIGGLNEKEVYVGGWHKNVDDGVLCCWDGYCWTTVAQDIAAVSDIHVTSDGSVWACGRGGMLLHGNRIDGFKDVSELDDTRKYVGIAAYDGQIFLATETGLYLRANGAIRRIKTGLDPEYNDGHILRVIDGVLWSIGYADIARFDGTSWERIPFPGNPPIR